MNPEILTSEGELKEIQKMEKKAELTPEQQKIYDQFLTKHKEMVEVIASKTIYLKGEKYKIPENQMNRFVICQDREVRMAMGGPGEHATLFRELLGKGKEEIGIRGAYGAGEVIIYSSPKTKEYNEDIVAAFLAALKKFNEDVELKRKDLSPGEEAARKALQEEELKGWKKRTGD